jgi:hypothetical protein
MGQGGILKLGKRGATATCAHTHESKRCSRSRPETVAVLLRRCHLEKEQERLALSGRVRLSGVILASAL